MATAPTLPGLYYQQMPARPTPSPLRSDVAGFVGRTRRGPHGRAVRVDGWREFEQRFGGLDAQTSLPYAMRGYFENGGQVAYVVRIVTAMDTTATCTWKVVENNDDHSHQLRAATAGIWGQSLRVWIRFLASENGQHTFEFVARAAGEVTERFRVVVTGVEGDGRTLEQSVARQSNLIRISIGEAPLLHGLVGPALPRQRSWGPLTFEDRQPVAGDLSAINAYRAAVTLLCDQLEVAMIAAPGISDELAGTSEEETASQLDGYLDFLAEAIKKAAELQDRLFLADVLPVDEAVPQVPAEAAIRFAGELRKRIPTEAHQRVAAVYHPQLRVDDPLGGVVAPLRTISPSGHIAGVISRMDRDRGAHYTPANVPLFGSVDIETSFDRREGGSLSEAGVNLVRCIPGRGLMVWGGRTLDLSREGRFVAHRRFIHRLIRALRRVAEPLVFETNGPAMWITLVRTITTVLLEAFRSGALKGERPEEAFRVRCDEQTNPLGEREQARVVCEIGLALAAPMEFITLRIGVSQMGHIEVFDV